MDRLEAIGSLQWEDIIQACSMFPLVAGPSSILPLPTTPKSLERLCPLSDLGEQIVLEEQKEGDN